MNSKKMLLKDLKKIQMEEPKRIVLYGAGYRGKIIAKNLEQFGFDFVFTDQNQNKLMKDMGYYKFAPIDELSSDDYIFVTPDNSVIQKEIEDALTERGIYNCYYLDCDWSLYDAVVSCFGEKEYGDIGMLEQQYSDLKKKYNNINIYLMWSCRVGELIYRFGIMRLALPADEDQYNLVVPYTVCGGDIANKRLMSIFSRYLNKIRDENSAFWRYVFLWHSTELNREKADYYDKYMEKELFLYKEPYVEKVSLNREETEEAQIKFRKLQIKNEFVCIHARDSYYLGHQYNVDESVFGYHDYRDFSINKYNKLAKYLSERNITVIRVGKGGNEKCNNPNIVDFAMDAYDELLDLYLNAKCKYYISTDTGAMLIPRLFARNTILINITSFIAAFFVQWRGGDEIFIPKLYYSKRQGRYLSIEEILIFDWEKTMIPPEKWGTSELIQDSVYIENTETDILETYIEADRRFCGEWEDDERGKELQRAYLNILKEFKKSHPIFPLYTRNIDECLIPYTISSTFLKKYSFLVEGN